MIKVAAVQGAPNYLDLTGTLSRMRTILEGAVDNGCQLIAFPEVYVAGDPDWVWLERPCIEQKLFPVLSTKLCADSRSGNHGAVADGGECATARRWHLDACMISSLRYFSNGHQERMEKEYPRWEVCRGVTSNEMGKAAILTGNIVSCCRVPAIVGTDRSIDGKSAHGPQSPAKRLPGNRIPSLRNQRGTAQKVHAVL
jgi:hypothetical protein